MPFKLSSAKPTIAVIATTTVLICGCATQTHDCNAALVSAQAAGRAGQMLDTHQEGACSAQLEQAWQSGLNQYCEPQNGFDLAYRGETQPELCNQNAFVNAYRHGQVLFELQTEQADLEQRVAELEQQMDSGASDLQTELTRLRNRLITIQRDLPEWLTLARLEGFLIPQAVPDQPATTDSN